MEMQLTESYEQRLQEVVKAANGEELLQLARSYPHLVAGHLALVVTEFVELANERERGTVTPADFSAAKYLVRYLTERFQKLNLVEGADVALVGTEV